MRSLIEDYLRPIPVKEAWKDIPNYEGLYQVSNYGRVKQTNGNILYQETHCKGYLRVKLRKDGKAKHHKVHRLVAQAFIPNFENKPQVNHIDNNNQNNVITNLEWVSDEENKLLREYQKKQVALFQ